MGRGRFEERNLGCPRNFAGMSRTPGSVQKVCAPKKFVRLFRFLGKGPAKNMLHQFSTFCDIL